MEFLWFLIFIVGAFLVYWVVGRGINRGTAVVAGAVTGKTRTRGLAAVHLGQKLSLPVDGQQLVDKLVETLELGPAWKDGLRLDALDEDHASMAIAIGGRTSETAKFFVTTEPSEGGSSGDAGAVSWREVEGRIPATESIERIQKHILSAVAQLGGSVTEHENS